MDLMLKLITHVEGVEMKQNILNVSNIKYFLPENGHTTETCSSASSIRSKINLR
jgi:hypothetical protein